NRADLLARRPRHHGNAGFEQVFAGQLEIGMPAAEETREQPRKAGVRLVEGLLETGASLAVDLADRVLQRLERVREIVVLRVEIRLSFGLLAKLVDRREIDRAETLNPALDPLGVLLPFRAIRVRRQLRDHL